MLEVSIKKIEIIALNPIIEAAKKEGLGFCKNTVLYGCFLDNEIIGFTGILWFKNKAVFKNHFVLPKYRRNKIFTKMLIFCIDIVKIRQVKLIEANCFASSISAYLALGGKIVKTFNNCKRIHIYL